MDPALQLLVYALVTVASNYWGVKALSKKLDTKADKKDVDKRFDAHHGRLRVVEQAHGGIIQ